MNHVVLMLVHNPSLFVGGEAPTPEPAAQAPKPKRPRKTVATDEDELANATADV